MAKSFRDYSQQGSAASTGTRREVVAILNAGGTFSAVTHLNDKLRDTTLQAEQAPALQDVISHNIDRHLYAYFGCNRHVGQRSEDVLIDWINVTPSDLIFSENATLSFWLRIADRLREYVQVCQHRVIGFIVIHGTDTISMATAALQFFIRSQSMPVLFVASNRPLMDDRLQGKRLSSFASDAWPNLLLAFSFILICGKSYKRCALSFANRIHYPINLRKVSGSATAQVAVPSYQSELRLQGIFVRPEAFVFHNLLLTTPYLCQEIGGHLCRSGFTTWPPSSTGDADDNILDLHFTANIVNQQRIDSIVEHVHATSSPSRSLPQSLDARIVLVETYASGTIPTDPKHPLTKSLLSSHARGRIIVLAGPYGIDLSQCYDHDALTSVGLRCLRLGPIVPETAVPLLATIATAQTTKNPKLQSGLLERILKEQCETLVSELGIIPPASAGIIVDSIGAN